MTSFEESDDRLPPLSVSVAEAARLLGVSKPLVYRLIREGELQSFFIGGRRLIRFSELEDYVVGREAEQREADS